MKHEILKMSTGLTVQMPPWMRGAVDKAALSTAENAGQIIRNALAAYAEVNPTFGKFFNEAREAAFIEAGVTPLEETKPVAATVAVG